MHNVLDVAGVVALITGAISLLGIILNLWFNRVENRKNRYIQIITKQTLKNNLIIRNNSELVTLLTRPEIINEARKNGDNKYIYKLMRAEINIEHHFKYAIPQEREIVEILRKLTKCAFCYFDHPSDTLIEELHYLGEEYYEKMSVYDYADWLYIKGQAKSKGYNKQFADFDLIYHKEANEHFKKENIPTPW